VKGPSTQALNENSWKLIIVHAISINLNYFNGKSIVKVNGLVKAIKKKNNANNNINN
jgi:hypothetical protein